MNRGIRTTNVKGDLNHDNNYKITPYGGRFEKQF